MATSANNSQYLKKVGDKTPRFVASTGTPKTQSGPLLLIKGNNVRFGGASRWNISVDAHHVQSKKGDIEYFDNQGSPFKPDYFVELPDLIKLLGLDVKAEPKAEPKADEPKADEKK